MIRPSRLPHACAARLPLPFVGPSMAGHDVQDALTRVALHGGCARVVVAVLSCILHAVSRGVGQDFEHT